MANDYPVEESRGKMLAVCFMLNGLGLILVLMPLRLLVSTVLLIGLKSGAPGQLKEREPMLATLRIGVRAAKNIRVALAYTAAVVVRGDMAVLSAFFALCWLPVLGYLLDRIDRVAGLALAMLLGGSGYLSLFFLDDPLGVQMYFAAVIGLFSLCGAIGILLVAKVGGTLSGIYGPVAPFVLVASASAARHC